MSSKSKRNRARIQSNKKNMKKSGIASDYGKNYYLLPIIIILCIIPLIVRLKYYNPNMSKYVWFQDNGLQPDFFLYYKHIYIIIVAAIMLLILILKRYYGKQKLLFNRIFILLGIYEALALLSTIFSRYRIFSVTGSLEQFESLFVILSYGVIAYYSYRIVKTEYDVKMYMKYVVIAAILIGLIGAFQAFGLDLFQSTTGQSLIVPSKYMVDGRAGLTFAFDKGIVYSTLYNPNYVGVFVSLLFPVILIMTFFQKKIQNIVISVIVLAGLLICLIGSGSAAGIISIGASLLLVFIFQWRILLKKSILPYTVILCILVVTVFIGALTIGNYGDKINNMFHNTAPKYKLEDIKTNKDNIELTYNGNRVYVEYKIKEDQSVEIFVYDDTKSQVGYSFDETTNSIQITDSRFTGISIGAGNYSGTIDISTEGITYDFTNQNGDGTYYYINGAGKPDKMYQAPSAVFTGHELIASNRGYIWSRTIPLLRNHILLGSGPDTFTLVFPQNDYVNIEKYGFYGETMTKPHSMYLQIAVQTGIISLIAFLLFYGWYFVTSIKLYLRGEYKTMAQKAGLAIFIGTVSYMICALTNDSTITVAPIFWSMLGVGIAINETVKKAITNKIN